MSRQRSFCRYCGAMTQHLDSCCSQHRDLLAAEEPPPDELESLPTMADEVADAIGTQPSPTIGSEH